MLSILIVLAAIVGGVLVTRNALRETQENHPGWSPHPLNLIVNPGNLLFAIATATLLGIVNEWSSAMVIVLWICTLIFLFGGIVASIVVLRWKRYRGYE